MRRKLENLLARVFGVKAENITDQTGPGNLPSWDSFNGLKLLDELEKGYEVKLNLEEMAEVKNVGDIRKILNRRGINV